MNFQLIKLENDGILNNSTRSARKAFHRSMQAIKRDFTLSGRSTCEISSIRVYCFDSGRIYTQVKLHNPTHKNTFIDEVYSITIGKRGATKIKCMGFSFGGMKNRNVRI